MKSDDLLPISNLRVDVAEECDSDGAVAFVLRCVTPEGDLCCLPFNASCATELLHRLRSFESRASGVPA